MTQTAAGHMASEGVGDLEPDGLASSWNDQPPARRALAVEETPHFQATPVRVDEAFPEYEAYHSVIEFPSYDAVAPAPAEDPASGWGDTPVVALPPVPRTEDYGWVGPAVDPQHQPPVSPGLAPYPMSAPEPRVAPEGFAPYAAPAPQVVPQDAYTIPAPIPAAYALAAAPNPYQTMAMGPRPMSTTFAPDIAAMQPQGLPDMYALAAPQSTYDIEGSGSQGGVAMMAVGGTFLVLKKVLTLVPFLLFAGLVTYFALMTRSPMVWGMAVFSYLTTLVALFGRRATASDLRRQKNVAAMMRTYLGK